MFQQEDEEEDSSLLRLGVVVLLLAVVAVAAFEFATISPPPPPPPQAGRLANCSNLARKGLVVVAVVDFLVVEAAVVVAVAVGFRRLEPPRGDRVLLVLLAS